MSDGAKGFVKFSSTTYTMKIELAGGLSTSVASRTTVEESKDSRAPIAGDYQGTLYDTRTGRREAAESAAQEREASRFRPTGLNAEDAAFLEEAAERQDAQLRSAEEQAEADRAAFEEARQLAAAQKLAEEEGRLRRALPVAFARPGSGSAPAAAAAAAAADAQGGKRRREEEEEEEETGVEQPQLVAAAAEAQQQQRPTKVAAAKSAKPLPPPPFAAAAQRAAEASAPQPQQAPAPAVRAAALVDYSDSEEE